MNFPIIPVSGALADISNEVRKGGGSVTGSGGGTPVAYLSVVEAFSVIEAASGDSGDSADSGGSGAAVSFPFTREIQRRINFIRVWTPARISIANKPFLRNSI